MSLFNVQTETRYRVLNETFDSADEAEKYAKLHKYVAKFFDITPEGYQPTDKITFDAIVTYMLNYPERTMKLMKEYIAHNDVEASPNYHIHHCTDVNPDKWCSYDGPDGYFYTTSWDDMINKMVSFIKNRQIIHAIKLVRANTNAGLLPAKYFVENFIGNNKMHFPNY